MTIIEETTCAIWPAFTATRWRASIQEDKYFIDSPRTGGAYTITSDAESQLRYMSETKENQRVKARLTTWLIESRQSGEDYPFITNTIVEMVRNRRDLRPHERGDRLLRHFVEISQHLGDALRRATLNSPFIAAISESSEIAEVDFLIRYLGHRGYVDDFRFNGLLSHVVVSVDGFAKVADISENTDPAQAFVAMWFGDEVEPLFDVGMKPAIEAAGYRPMRIDQKPDANKIDDEIIAEIRRSRFVVADFTHGETGARGGVYYEAGFAYGLDIPVIFTCRADTLDKIHFDTRQYSHIPWTEPKDLIEPLKNRILARIGDGPDQIVGSCRLQGVM